MSSAYKNQNRLAFLFALGLFFVFPLLDIKPISSADRRPNVVVMLADDAGWGDYGCNGNTTVETPNIDALARDGITFEHFYVCPVCSPTRAEFLTGRYHPRCGVSGVSMGQERLNLTEKTIADYLHEAGYVSGLFGKWHNGSQWPYHPQARGFDQFFGYTSGHWGEYFDPPVEVDGKMKRETGYIVDRCTDRAIQFIEAHQSKPFFCYIPFTTPHSPWAAPEKNWNKYKNQTISQPATAASQESIDQTRCALAMIENQDENVGRILKRIDELGLRQDTIVIYFSDNGPNTARWNGGMKGKKGSTDEGGVRSPLWIRWPDKIRSGATVNEIAGAIDLLPTLATMLDIKLDSAIPLDGLDMSPLLMLRKGSNHEAHGASSISSRLLFSYFNGQASARSQQYRLDAKGALFDMIDDPGQTKDISKDLPEITESLAQSIAKWRRDVLNEVTIDVPKEMTATEAITATKRKLGKIQPKQSQLIDDRPFTVGYRDFPWTPLPARDGVPHGGIKRSSAAPNCSYFVNWTSKEDSITWDIEVHEKGNYEVLLDYTCPESDAGSIVELSFGKSKIQAKVSPAWNPPLYENQDTLPRSNGESKMKEFRPLHMGVIQLESGRNTLILQALEIPGKTVMDLRRVNLTLQ